MPRPPKIPKYALHKASGHARVVFGGREHFLGQYGTDESWERYQRLIAERVLAGGNDCRGAAKPSQELLDAGRELLTKRLPPRHPPVRLLGFGATNLDDSGASQQQLFDQPERERHRQVDRVADQITARFGKLAIRRGVGAKREV